MLCIQNKGEAPIEAYTLLGYSTARGNDKSIGQFGTGAKHGVCVLLRAGIDVKIYCGTQSLTFGTREDEVNGKTVTRVTVKVGTRKPRDLDWILDFGAIDWTEVRMALREFVANAIDQSEEEGPIIKMVETMRAKEGYTQVYVGDHPEVRQFYANLGQHFLHFSGRQTEGILTKAEPSPCRIYRSGVFIRELREVSLCDYNFAANQLAIDECRNLNDYSAKASIARLYQTASVDDLVRVFQAQLDGLSVLENVLDAFYLTYGPVCDQFRTRWRKAWAIASNDAVPCPSSATRLGAFAQKKGYKVVEQPSEAWYKALHYHGIDTLEKVLDGSESQGRRVTEATTDAEQAVRKAWGWIVDAGLTEKSCPPVRGFEEIMNGESECLGYVLPGENVVYLRNDIGGQLLLQTALEECAHIVTGATDGSRDLQDFAFRLITRWLA